MRILLLICRILVGATFIISGLIKANDPIGFSIKLEEYFAPSALGLPWLIPFSLGLAMLACLAEVVLGFAVLVGGRMKLATWSLLLLTLFFGWLTAYTATCDPQGTYAVIVDGVKEMRDVTCVTDCGCFGDAMKGSLGRSLTPWESFSKDMVLLVFVIPLFIFRKRVNFNTWGDDLAILPVSMALLAFYCWVFSWWFPLLFSLVVLAGYMIIKRILQGPRAEWATAAWVAVATAAFMVAIVVALVASWMVTRHIPVMALVTGVIVLVFGTLTLVLHDETFIKVKPTIIYGLFAAVLGGGLLFGRSFIAIMFDQVFNLTPQGWRILTLRWTLFFVAMAILNEVVWRTQSTDFWVGFKAFGVLPLTMAFAVSQMPLVKRYHLEPASLEASEAEAGDVTKG